MKKTLSVLSLLSILFTFSVSAQNGEIRGFVYDKSTGEPIIFTNVVIRELNLGKATDINGFYTITKLKPGNYTLMCWSVGFDTARATVEIKSGRIVSQNLYLVQKKYEMAEVEIKGEKVKHKENVNISVNTITQKELKQLPTFGGEPDLVQYLQVLPGVVFSGDQGGQLYIRGGSPVMNKVMLDGMIIYNPFHSIGLFSVFDADIIRNADVYAGGFNAQYGGRIGGIIDVNTREGNKKRFSGKISANPITAKVLLEGPISEFSEGGASASYILSYKTSYLNHTAPTLYNYGDAKRGLPYSFDDVYGKYSYIGPNGSRVNLFGFNFIDNANFAATDYRWTSTGAGANLMLIPEGSSTIINGTFGYSNYGIMQTEADNLPRKSSINGFNAGLNFTYFFGKDDIKYGIDLVGFSTDFSYVNSYGRTLTQTDNTTEIGGFVKYKKVLGRFVLEPGLRVQSYSSLSEQSFEPRLGLKYNASSYLRIKASGGMYSQNLLAAVSDQDVVNLFYGFVSSPDQVNNSSYRRQTAQHAAVGFELDLGKHSEINVEGFYKNFSQIVNINRDKKYEDNDANADKPDNLKADYIVETGNSFGMDCRYKYDYKRFYFWAVYSLTFVNRNDGTRDYFPNFDRRHNINLVGTYTWGNKQSWSLNTRWNFGSGFPFTQTQGQYESLNFTDGIGTDIRTQNGTLASHYTDINTGRLPYFHRLDMSLSKKFHFGEHKTMTITAAATNVYDRANIFYFDRNTHTRINQLPIIPTLGFNYTF